MPDIYAELEKLRKENETLRRALKRKDNINSHGKTTRRYDIPDNIKEKLFGVMVDGHELKPTNDAMTIRTNCNTFLSNLVRALCPYPRYNKTNGWVTNKPLIEMTDKEYRICVKLVNDVMKLVYAAKIKIEQEEKK